MLFQIVFGFARFLGTFADPIHLFLFGTSHQESLFCPKFWEFKPPKVGKKIFSPHKRKTSVKSSLREVSLSHQSHYSLLA